MSKTSYIRVLTPEDQVDGGSYGPKFQHAFDSAGGTNGAKVLKISTDAHNRHSTPLLSVMINGSMTSQQAKLIPQMA